MIDIFSLFRRKFTIQSEEMTAEDRDDMRTLVEYYKYPILKKLINNRIARRTGELVSGIETRDRIDELADLLRELEMYENS